MKFQTAVHSFGNRNRSRCSKQNVLIIKIVKVDRTEGGPRGGGINEIL